MTPIWKRIKTSPFPGPIVLDEDMMSTNPSFEVSRKNLNTLVKKYNYTPTPKDIRGILKWLAGDEKLRQIVDEGGALNKATLEKMWKEETANLNVEILMMAEQPEEPTVPTARDTMLTRKAQEKFDEAMAMGGFLTSDMRKAMMESLQETSEESTRSLTSTDV